MNIRELLSPQDSPAAETPPQRLSPSPHISPNKHPSRSSSQQRKSSGLSTSITLSPTHQHVQLPSIIAHNNHQNLALPAAGITSAPYPQPTYSGPSTGANPAYLTIHRQSSTPQMDKLAELASMQHHHHQQQQGAGQNSNSPQDTHSPDTQRFSLQYVLWLT
jgi:squamous cell carcinoma antigen recognized by T-cells 3